MRRARRLSWICGATVALAAAAAAGAEGPGAWMTQGAADLRSGALGQAEQAFRKAAALAPQSARPVLWLGVVAVARGDRSAAVAWFNEALRRHPDLAEQGCAAVWLDMLGIEVTRPQWRLRTGEDYAAFVRAANSGLSSGQARWVGYALVSAADRSRLDPRILAAVVYIESRFNHHSISSAGAEGLGQLMPGTAGGLGVDPRDPLQNLVGAAAVLRQNLDEFHTLPLALAAYNAGRAAVSRWGGIPPYAETQWYVWAVLWVYGGLR